MLKTITWRDVLIAILFALFALAFQMQRWGGYDPAIFINGDAANLASFAAARANPHLFIGDTLLEKFDNYKFYTTVHIFAIQALGWLTGDYGKGIVFLLGPLVLIHLLGYYILGRVLYQNRFWALILSLTTSVYIFTPIGDDVGLMFDPLPGFAFGALLPYLLSAIIRFQDDTDKWKIIIACCAGLIYVHPVSGPSWVFGLWLFYALSNQDGLAVWQRVRRAFALGIVAFLVALPFAVLYVSSHDTAPNDPVKAAAIMDAIKARMEPSFLNPILAISVFSKWLITDFYYTYFALLSLCFLLYGKTYRKEARVLITVVCGVVLFSTLIPCVEYLRTVNSGVPLQIDLIRPLKYVVPIIFVLSIWGLCALQERMSQSIKSEYISSVISVLIGLMFVFYVHRKDPSVVRSVYPILHAWRHGDLWPGETTKGPVHVEAIRAVRRFTPERSKIFAASYLVLQVRYAALRPVVYAYKDGGIFAYSNYNALLKWYEIHRKLGRINRAGYSPAELEQTIIPIARELDADYIFVYFGDYFEKIDTNADSRENFAAKAIVITSTVFSNGHDFSVALEGEDDHAYVAASAPGPATVILDFGSEISARSLELTQYHESEKFTDYSIHLSKDQLNWQVLYDTSDSNTHPSFVFSDIRQNFLLPSNEKFRYIRLNFRSSIGQNRFLLKRFAVYGEIKKDNPHDIDLNGLSNVWSNLNYGLYKLVK